VFERYNETARRVVFAAREQASRLHAESVGTEHLLLALIAKREGLLGRLLTASEVQVDGVCREIDKMHPAGEIVASSLEMPLASETRQVLDFAADEADRFEQCYVGPEHLFLGLVRNETCVAASILRNNSTRIDPAFVRAEVGKLFVESVPPATQSQVQDQPLGDRLEMIKRLVRQLGQMAEGRDDAAELVRQIQLSLDSLKGSGESA
jgi:ATP-dependent Clp protease ATP-binding subunit ClpC